jgi:hypothetical protein
MAAVPDIDAAIGRLGARCAELGSAAWSPPASHDDRGDRRRIVLGATHSIAELVAAAEQRTDRGRVHIRPLD